MTASDWNPDLYDRFADDRERPSRDLIARVRLTNPRRIVDLGCGSGLSTRPLLERFPAGDILGIDTSPAMIDKARHELPAARFELGDVATWEADGPVDLLFANAVLQWLPDHASLLPRLIDQLAPGGILAVQMPDNLDEPCQRAMREVARSGPWAERLAGAEGARTILPTLGETYDLLAPRCRIVDLWTTTYQHILDGREAIVDWFRSTGLRPFLDPLDPTTRDLYLAAYRQRLVPDYPLQADGKVLLPFPRRFIVAIK